MSEEEMERRNAARNHRARQRQRRVHTNHRQKRGQFFDQLGLTKRNTNYMYRFSKALHQTKLKPARQRQIIHQMITELRADQKRGITARNKYGSVAHRIHLILHPPKKLVPINHNYWPNAIYNVLIFFIMFNVLYGITYLISKQAQNQKGAAGFVGLLITSIVAGLGMPIITRLFDDRIKHQHNGLVRGLVMILMFVAWMAVFYLSTRLPRMLNPVLNPWINIALAIVSLGAAFWVHHRYDVTSAFHARH